MCLFPLGGMGGAGGGGLSGFLIPPSKTGRTLTNIFKPLVICHFCMCILELVSTQYADGVFDLIAALIGLYVIRNPDGFGMQSLCCYMVFCYALFIWDVIRAALYFSGSDTSLAPDPDWQYYLFVFVCMAMPFLLITIATLAWFIRKDLERSIEDMQEQMATMLNLAPGGGGGGFGGMMSGGYAMQQQMPQRSPEPSGATYSSQAPASQQRSAAPSGFRAFQGPGNRLGGT